MPEPKRGGKSGRIVLKGEIPSPLDPPPGCYFSTRCPIADEQCRKVMPSLVDLGGGRQVRCHKPGVFKHQ